MRSLLPMQILWSRLQNSDSVSLKLGPEIWRFKARRWLSCRGLRTMIWETLAWAAAYSTYTQNWPCLSRVHLWISHRWIVTKADVNLQGKSSVLDLLVTVSAVSNTLLTASWSGKQIQLVVAWGDLDCTRNGPQDLVTDKVARHKEFCPTGLMASS